MSESFFSGKYGWRARTIGFDFLIVTLVWLGFHGSEMKPVESGVWVLAAVCFIRLGLILHMLQEKDDPE